MMMISVFYITFAEKTDLVNKIIVFSNGLKAINFLKDEMGNKENIPDVLFLDICQLWMGGSFGGIPAYQVHDA
jgi:hypothetical protein